ncbi:uncharacterized protein LOC131063116 [Cryptomeria japonica]|uniref:uncharacterized protein LOC131063116 n=1 Tax=Cryptomeria japonica TaxID=3369 RepID=UPI0025AD122A|nr:uncharacterized protein LOC131063116 [Cryptomeria japonica]
MAERDTEREHQSRAEDLAERLERAIGGAPMRDMLREIRYTAKESEYYRRLYEEVVPRHHRASSYAAVDLLVVIRGRRVELAKRRKLDVAVQVEEDSGMEDSDEEFKEMEERESGDEGFCMASYTIGEEEEEEAESQQYEEEEEEEQHRGLRA